MVSVKLIGLPSDWAGACRHAITALNGSDMGGRSLTVNEAKPMEQRSGGGGGFGGGGGRGPGGKRDRW